MASSNALASSNACGQQQCFHDRALKWKSDTQQRICSPESSIKVYADPERSRIQKAAADGHRATAARCRPHAHAQSAWLSDKRQVLPKERSKCAQILERIDKRRPVLVTSQPATAADGPQPAHAQKVPANKKLSAASSLHTRAQKGAARQGGPCASCSSSSLRPAHSHSAIRQPHTAEHAGPASSRQRYETSALAPPRAKG